MPMDIATNRIQIGNEICWFTTCTGGANDPRILIMAHGKAKVRTPKFDVPRPSLR